MKSMLDGIILVNEKNDQITYHNPAFDKLFGYKDLNDVLVTDILPDYKSFDSTNVTTKAKTKNNVLIEVQLSITTTEFTVPVQVEEKKAALEVKDDDEEEDEEEEEKVKTIQQVFKIIIIRELGKNKK
jgi:PAS domain-containing protein